MLTNGTGNFRAARGEWFPSARGAGPSAIGVGERRAIPRVLLCGVTARRRDNVGFCWAITSEVMPGAVLGCECRAVASGSGGSVLRSVLARYPSRWVCSRAAAPIAGALRGLGAVVRGRVRK